MEEERHEGYEIPEDEWKKRERQRKKDREANISIVLLIITLVLCVIALLNFRDIYSPEETEENKTEVVNISDLATTTSISLETTILNTADENYTCNGSLPSILEKNCHGTCPDGYECLYNMVECRCEPK